MQYTDNEAALIGGLISTYFFQPAVSASLKDAYSRVLEHLHQNALTSSDLQQIRSGLSGKADGGVKTPPPGGEWRMLPWMFSFDTKREEKCGGACKA